MIEQISRKAGVGIKIIILNKKGRAK